jgi:nucleoside-diphosphate-sugar epimerase
MVSAQFDRKIRFSGRDQIVIRWIAPFLGTAPASSVIPDSGQCLLDVRDLVDKEGNAAAAIRNKIERGLDLLRHGNTVIIGCDYGISRSNAIAAGILSAYREMPFDQAVSHVIATTGEQEMKLGPLEAVRQALGEVKKIAVSGINVLMTGGSGFIGSVLCPMLEENWPVLAPSMDEANLAKGAALLDLLVRKHGITHLVHLASPRVYTTNRAVGEMITMLRNVLEVCRENNLYLVYPSSWEIYSGYRGIELKADEKLSPNPKGPYGEAKWLCEQLIDHYRRKYGLRCGLLRSSFLYGATAHRPKFLWTFIANAMEGTPIHTHEYRNGFPRLDLMHVSDLCKAILASIQSDFKGDVNVGTGRLISTRQIAIMIRDLLESSSEILTRTVNDEAPNIAMEIALARENLSWTPSVVFEEGLSAMVRFLSENCQHATGEVHARLE